ncbi:tetratricopeptide repeat-containing sensor histidine kinase [Marinoscillum sp.]|uniref:tetratricopeptide repeat-containing sensor histidine kinase n=1 Tax=Marinoscillum sp. TaxID=2024838 RepID=UPI003BAB645B
MKYLSLIFLCFIALFHVAAQTPKISELKELYATTASDSVQVQTLINLINEYIGHNPDSLAYFAQKLDTHPGKDKNRNGQKSVNVAYAMYYYDKAEFDSSIVYIDKNIEISIAQGDSVGISSNLTNASIVLIGQSKYQTAIEYLLRALAIQEGNEKFAPKFVANTYNVISMAYHNMKNFETAQEYQWKALNVYKANAMETDLIRSYTNLGSNFLAMNKNDSAMYYFGVGLSLSRKNKDERKLAELSRMIGDLYLKEQKYDSAQFHYENSLQYFGDNKSTKEVTEAMVGLGTVYYEKGNYQRAYEMHKQAKDLFADRGDELETSRTLWLMSKDLQKLGRYEDAYLAIAESKTLSDTLQAKNSADAIAEMQVKYETEKKEKDLALQGVQLSAQELELNRQELLRNVAIAGALLLGVVALLIFQIKSRSNKTITAKNDLLGKSLSEREALLKEIHHRVKNNLQIIASLLYLQSDESENLDAKRLLEEGQGRVRSMALIHQKLYENDDLKHIPFDEYLNELIGEIKLSFGDMAKDVALEVEAKNIFFDVDTAVPLGLIINELSTNAFKYAFTQRMGGGVFKVVLQHEEGAYHLTVSDNGSGIPDELMHATQSASLGLKLTRMLSDQLEGDYHFSNSEGTTFELKFAV